MMPVYAMETFSVIGKRKRTYHSVERVYEDSDRPLAVKQLIRELSEVDPHKKRDEIDGQYLYDLLELLGDELEALMLIDRSSRAQLVHIWQHIQEARAWALNWGIRKNAQYVLDRRKFKEGK